MNSISSRTSSSSSSPTTQNPSEHPIPKKEYDASVLIDKMLAVKQQSAGSSLQASPDSLFMVPPTKEGHLAVKTLTLLLLQKDLQPFIGASGWKLRAVNRTLNQAFFGGTLPSPKKMLTLFGELAKFSSDHINLFVEHGRSANKSFNPDAEIDQFHPVIYDKINMAMKAFSRSLASLSDVKKYYETFGTEKRQKSLLNPILPHFSADMFSENLQRAGANALKFGSSESSMEEFFLMMEYSVQISQARALAHSMARMRHDINSWQTSLFNSLNIMR